jgi:protein-S-isoprenylcysteine O-methyltransferase Ste14
MTERNRRILALALVVAAVLLLGYAGLVIALMARGDYEVGPVRVITLVANVATGALCVWGAWRFGRTPPADG